MEIKFESIEQKIIYERLMAEGVQSESKYENLVGIALSNNRVLTLSERRNIQRDMVAMYCTKENISWQPIVSYKSGILGKGIVFLKRCIRKLMFWYVEPVCVKQSQFNDAAYSLLGRLSDIENNQLQRVKELQKCISEMENRLEELEERLNQSEE